MGWRRGEAWWVSDKRANSLAARIGQEQDGDIGADVLNEPLW